MITLRKKILLLFLLLMIFSVLFYFDKSIESPAEKTEEKTNYNFNEDLMIEINNEINMILSSYGIQDKWIKDKKNIKEKPKWFQKEVMLPKDINASEIILELSNYIKRYNLYDKVYEEPKSKNVAFDIFKQKDSVLENVAGLDLIYSDSVRRENKYVTLILDNLQNYKLENAINILSSTERFSVILPLSNEKSDYQAAIFEHNKDFILKFSVGDEKDMTADFRTDMPEKAWKSKIKTASLAYYKTSGVILTGKPEVYSFINDITDEFRRNNINVYPEKNFIFFLTKDPEDKGKVKITELVYDIESKSKTENYLFYIVDLSSDEFAIYEKEIYALKKRGFRFNNFRSNVRRFDKNTGEEITAQ